MIEGLQIHPAQGEWTYDDYLKLPDDNKRYEIIEGNLYVSTPPSADHQLCVIELICGIGNFVKMHKLGRVLVAP